MLGGLEADPQFLRLGIEQEKTYLCVIRFSELHGTFLLKARWKRSGVIMPMHLPSGGLYMQVALASYSFGREAVCGVYQQWRSILHNIIFLADKVHCSDPNFIVPCGSDVHMWISWLQIEAGFL